MTSAELGQEIGIEFASIGRIVEELGAILRDIAGREPTTRELAADVFAAFQSAVDRHLAAIPAEDD